MRVLLVHPSPLMFSEIIPPAGVRSCLERVGERRLEVRPGTRPPPRPPWSFSAKATARSSRRGGRKPSGSQLNLPGQRARGRRSPRAVSKSDAPRIAPVSSSAGTSASVRRR